MGKRKKNKNDAKTIMHYSSRDLILLVGEGDFSFAACLARAFCSATNIVATSLDSKENLVQKYSKVAKHLEELEELGCEILHGVDAHTMNRHPLLKHKRFDKIVFNFPHAALVWGESQPLQIKIHQKLVKGFMMSASEMLATVGEIHITHKTSYPFCDWEINELAEHSGLVLVDEADFHLSDYPGYCNKRGQGRKCGTTFPVGACSTFMFALA